MSKKDKKSVDVKKESTEKLNNKIVDLKKELFTLRFQSKMSELNDTSLFKKNRRMIAKVKTELSARKIMGEKNA